MPMPAIMVRLLVRDTIMLLNLPTGSGCDVCHSIIWIVSPRRGVVIAALEVGRIRPAADLRGYRERLNAAVTAAA
jgi:hypothetical protein